MDPLRPHTRTSDATAAAGIALAFTWPLLRLVNSSEQYRFIGTLIPPLVLWAFMRGVGQRGNYALPYGGGILLYGVLDPVSRWRGDASWTWRCALFVAACALLGWYDGRARQHKPANPRSQSSSAVRVTKAAAAGALAIALHAWIDSVATWLAEINHVGDLPPLGTINNLVTIPLVLCVFMYLSEERQYSALLGVAGIAFPLGFAPLYLGIGWHHNLGTDVVFVALCVVVCWLEGAKHPDRSATAASS